MPWRHTCCMWQVEQLAGPRSAELLPNSPSLSATSLAPKGHASSQASPQQQLACSSSSSSSTLGIQLLQAASSGNTNMLQELVQQQGVNVNQPHAPQGRTALHIAAECGQQRSCRTLLELGADTYVVDEQRVSALMLGAKHGHHGVVKILLDAGADAFHVDGSGTNALLLAAACGSAATIKLLLEEGYADADYHNSDLGRGEHALLLAAEGGWPEAVALLLAAGAKINRTDKEGRTALWVASRAGHAQVVALLLAQPHVKHIRHFASSTTPIMEARAAGHAGVVSMLAAHLALQQQGLTELSQLQVGSNSCRSEHHQQQQQLDGSTSLQPAKGQSQEGKEAAQQQLGGCIKQPLHPQKQQLGQQSRASGGQLPSGRVCKVNSSSSTLLVSSTSSPDVLGSLTAAGTLQSLPPAPVALAY